MQVPLLDLKGQYAPLRAEIEQALREVCDEQRFVLGPRVAELEHEVAEYCGTKHALGVSSGTDALLLALMALEIGPGDEVVTSPFTFFATAGVIARLGARPFFCDIDPATFNLDPNAVRTALANRCEPRGDRLVNRATGGVLKALLPVHLYGQMADLGAIAELARARGLVLIEDACQAHGASLDGTLLGDPAGKRAGAMGRAGAHSFYPTKNLGAIGDGGAIVSDDPDLIARARVLRYGGQVRTYWHSDPNGVNSRLDELQAAILRAKLSHLAAATAERRRQARRYLVSLAGTRFEPALELARALGPTRHAYHLFVVQSPHRDRLRAVLAERGIQTLVHYPHALHQQPAFVAGARHPLPNAEALAGSVFSLPLYPGFGDREQDEVITALAELAG
jgi:dTDP-4-amino-4,6-dideoxygalactose transaminase